MSHLSSVNRKPLVYLAAPYTKGDVAVNVHSQMRVFMELLDDGIVIPDAPLFSHFAHLMFPRHYETWIRFDLERLEHCDACLRLDATHEGMGYVQAASSGADNEVTFCHEINVPVFYTKKDLYDWVTNGKITSSDQPENERADTTGLPCIYRAPN